MLCQKSHCWLYQMWGQNFGLPGKGVCHCTTPPCLSVGWGHGTLYNSGPLNHEWLFWGPGESSRPKWERVPLFPDCALTFQPLHYKDPSLCVHGSELGQSVSLNLSLRSRPRMCQVQHPLSLRILIFFWKFYVFIAAAIIQNAHTFRTRMSSNLAKATTTAKRDFY